MDEMTSESQKPNDKTVLDQPTGVTTEKAVLEAADLAVPEHRKAYGTAKTENLRDSEAWRFLLPAFVIVLCALVLAIPLIILIPLFVTSLDVTAYTHNLVWLWVTMIVIEVAVAIFIIRGVGRIFLTQAGNY
ncbi:MAG: hypothetical protein ACR2H5_04600 [Ktedonobacteraceae bacterium]